MPTNGRCLHQAGIPLQHLFLVLVSSTLAGAVKIRHGQDRTLSSSRNLQNEWSKPDYNLYHRKDALLQEVTEIAAAHQDTFSVEIRNVSDAGYDVQVMVVTVDLGGLNKSKGAKMRYLIDFGEHARELISSELGLHFLKTLADPTALQSLLGSGAREKEMIRMLKEEVAFKILPMENTRGREMVERDGKLCERKNGRGVDPNRNWEVDWGKKEKDYDPNEEYPGLKPFSEPEVQVVLSLAKEFKPHVWVNIHSGMEAMFAPWDHQAVVPESAQEALGVLQTIHKELFADHKECVVGSGGKSVGYLAHGTATDYMFERLKVPLPFTWEIFGDLQADYHDCFKMFNPISKEQYDATILVWLKSLYRLIELTPKHSVVEADIKAARLAEQQRLAEEQKLDQQRNEQQAPGQVSAHSSPGQVLVINHDVRGNYTIWILAALGFAGLVALLVGATKYLKGSSTHEGLSALSRKGRGNLPI